MSAGHPLHEPPWGSLLGVYFMLIGITTGINLLCWWIRPRDQRSADAFEWVTSWVALGALGIAGLLLVIDLGRPTRFFLMLTEFSNLRSPMSVGAKLIAIKMFLLCVYLYLLYRRRQAHEAGDIELAPGWTTRLYRTVPTLLGLASFALAIYPATLLSRTWVSPLATSSGAAIIFLTTALLMGTAVAAITALLVPGVVDDPFRARLSRMIVFFICADVVVLGFEGLSLYGNQPGLVSALHEMTRGGAATVFWGLVVVAGLVLPLIGLVGFSRHRVVTLTSAFAVLVGAGATRFLFFTIQ